MSRPDVSAVLRQTLSPVVTEHALLLEDVRVRGGGRHRTVTVVVDLPDGPGGVSSDQLDDVSRAVSARLDQDEAAEAALPGPYRLEVTTPGVTRPLTEPRHFRRAQGRLVTITTPEGPVHGRLVRADDDGLQVQGSPARRGTTAPDPVMLGWEQVQRGTVEVEFTAPG